MGVTEQTDQHKKPKWLCSWAEEEQRNIKVLYIINNTNKINIICMHINIIEVVINIALHLTVSAL